jgi:hypothetical protein
MRAGFVAPRGDAGLKTRMEEHQILVLAAG